MKKKIAVMLCGILLFTMLPAGCGNAGAQAGDQGAAEQVSDGKTQDESEEQEKLSDGEDDKSDAGKDAVTDKDTGDLGASKDDTENSQGGKAATGGANSEDSAQTGNNASGSKAGSAADGNASNGTGGKTSGSGSSGGNGSNGSGPSGSGSNSGNAGSGNASSNTGNTSDGTSTSQPEHIHSWEEQTTTVTHEAVGHYETVVVKDAWDEEITERRAVCGCGGIFKDEMEWLNHVLQDECIYGYSVKPVTMDTIHHEAQTQEVWVEDSPARTEIVGTGSYICSSCGAAK